MSLLNNKDKGGNSSKFSYNHSVLKGLQSISDNTGDLAGILAPLLAAIAQETTLMSVDATLISVLNAIVASDQDIEILLVRDTGNNDEVVQQITNYETGIPVVDIQGCKWKCLVYSSWSFRVFRSISSIKLNVIRTFRPGVNIRQY